MKTLDEISTEIFDVAKKMPVGEDSDTLFDCSRELSEACHSMKSIQLRKISDTPESWGIFDERTKSVIANGTKKEAHDWVTGLTLDLMASYYDRFETEEDEAKFWRLNNEINDMGGDQT